MKKMFIILALAMVSFANAQKGSILVAGSIGFDASKTSFLTSDTKNNTFNFSPKIGYQVTDNWTFGIEASVSGSKAESNSSNFFVTASNNDKRTGITAGAFARYSKPLSEIFSIYADIGAGFQSIKRTVDNNDGLGNPTSITTTTDKGNGMYVGVTPAVFINLKKNFGLNFSIGGLGYQTLNLDNNGGDNSEFYFNFGQTVNIGISKNF